MDVGAVGPRDGLNLQSFHEALTLTPFKRQPHRLVHLIASLCTYGDALLEGFRVSKALKLFRHSKAPKLVRHAPNNMWV